MEPGDGSKIDRDTRVDSVTTLGEADLSISSKSLSRSSSLSLSSSSSGSSRHFFTLGENTIVQSSADTTNTLKLDEENVLGPLDEENFATSATGTSQVGATSFPKPDEDSTIKPLMPDSVQTLLAMEHGHSSESNDNLRPYPASSLGEAAVSSRSKKLSPSSSSSSSVSESSPQDTFSLGAHATSKSSIGANSILDHDKDMEIVPSEPDLSMGKVRVPSLSTSSPSSSEPSYKEPLQMSASATNESSVGGTGPPSLDKDSRLASDYGKDIPVSSMPKNEQSSHELAGVPSPLVVSGHSTELSVTEKSATQFPPMQAMERTTDSAPAPYRIPSHVFARTKSTAPVEWSTNSNESLFSIHMGNMSFTREQLYWLGKSGELDKQGEATGIFLDLPNNLPPTNKSGEIGPKMVALDEGPQFTELAAAATMREVIKENEDKRSKDSPSMTEGTSHSASPSAHSDGSTRSFAFPILTGEGDKGDSLKVGSSKKKWKSRPLTQPQTPKESPNTARTSKVDPYESHNGWLSYFSCCSVCSLGH